MRLSELENFVIHKGIMGCPLDTVPVHILNQFNDSKALEIVKHDPKCDFPASFLEKTPDSDVFQLQQLKSYKDYDIRFKFEMWRRVVFKGLKLHSNGMSRLIHFLIQNPEGASRNEIYQNLTYHMKRMNEWTDRLTENNIVRVKNDFYTFNFDWIDGECELPDDLFTSAAYCITFKQAHDLGLLEEIPERIKKPEDKKATKTKEMSILNKMQLSRILSPEKLNKIEDVIKEYDHGVELHVLRKKLKMNRTETNDLVNNLKKRKNFQVIGSGKNSDMISYLGEMNSVYYDAEEINFLIDICRTARVFILSELPNEISKMKNAMNLDDQAFIPMLEDQGFTIIEIRSIYVNPQFVVFSNSVESDDPLLLEVFEKAKNNVSNIFKSKIEMTFLRNAYMSALDNNFSSSFQERVDLFYKFILSQIKINNGYFYLNNSSLLKMKFSTFVQCVPLRSEFQFLSIARDAAKRYKSLKSTLDKIKDYEFENLDTDQFEEINSELLEKMKKYTVSDILKCFKEHSDEYNDILSRIDVHEFYRIILSLVQFNIFDGFRNDRYYYLEKIKGTEKHIESLFAEIPDESAESNAPFVSFPNRKFLFDQILNFSQEEFVEKTRNVIESNFVDQAKDFFLKKLSNFK